MSLLVNYKKKYERNKNKNFFASLKSMKKGVGSGVGSGSVSQRRGSANPDPQIRIRTNMSQIPNSGDLKIILQRMSNGVAFASRISVIRYFVVL